jgi:hypothetical protein
MKAADPDAISPAELIAAFAAAVDHALMLAPGIRRDWRDPFAHAAALDEALGPYRAAMGAFTLATGEGWSDDDLDAVWNAQAMAEHQLAGLLELASKAPRVLGERLVAIERDGGVLFQEQPGDGPGPAAGGGGAGAPADCCFTLIKFKNVHSAKVRVTARHADGATTSEEFDAGAEHTLHWSARGSPAVPGALGHCVDLELQAKEGNGWGEVLRLRLCCEHDAQGGVTPKKGDKLTLTGDAPPPPPGDGPHTLTRPPRLQALEITQIECADPCPETQSGSAGNASAGEASSGISKLPGARVARDYWHYGVWVRLRFRPDGCRNFCFVQGVKRKAWLKGSATGTYQPRVGMSTRNGGTVFVLDVVDKDGTPCYPHVSEIDGGGKELRDFPGVKNPFGTLGLDGVDKGPLPAGSVLKVQWTFRTWVVCTNPAPVAVLGRFDWGFTVEITVGRNAAGTTVVFTPEPPAQPAWSDDPDLDTYRRVAREAKNNAGFLPP